MGEQPNDFRPVVGKSLQSADHIGGDRSQELAQLVRAVGVEWDQGAAGRPGDHLECSLALRCVTLEEGIHWDFGPAKRDRRRLDLRKRLLAEVPDQDYGSDRRLLVFPGNVL
jgi:hypothetical protein